MVTVTTKNILDEYDLDKELDKLDMEYCLPEYFYLSYEWRRYLNKRKKVLKEIKVCLSEYSI